MDNKMQELLFIIKAGYSYRLMRYRVQGPKGKRSKVLYSTVNWVQKICIKITVLRIKLENSTKGGVFKHIRRIRKEFNSGEGRVVVVTSKSSVRKFIHSKLST